MHNCRRGKSQHPPKAVIHARTLGGGRRSIDLRCDQALHCASAVCDSGVEFCRWIAPPRHHEPPDSITITALATDEDVSRGWYSPHCGRCHSAQDEESQCQIDWTQVDLADSSLWFARCARGRLSAGGVDLLAVVLPNAARRGFVRVADKWHLSRTR
jgi:hypothetical protein